MREKTFEKKEELIAAALDEFTTKSYEEASLNQIIKNARISKGTFYYHFQDKQDLYLSLLKHGMQAKWKFINHATEELKSESGQDIFASFKLQARMGVQFARAHPKYHLLSKMFVKEKGNQIYEAALAALGKVVDVPLDGMIQAAIERGTFNEDFSPTFIKRIITHLFANFDEIFKDEADHDLDQMLKNLDAYVDFMKYGLGRD